MPQPDRILDTEVESLRAAGLSNQKASYLHDLARHCESGRLRINHLADLPEEAIRESLVQVKGIGVWSADMFMMFTLCRPDIWPTLDLGIQKGAANVLGKGEKLTPKELAELGERWRPWRSVASWYLWRTLEVELPAIQG